MAPKALQDRPDVWEHLAFAWAAWWELHSDRPIGMGGAGAIPFSAIDRYAERYGLIGDAFETFIDLIRAMEGVYRDWQDKRSKRS